MDNISKGILKDGMSLQENDWNFNVNGIGEPTLNEFNRFISEFSDYLGTEIAGIRLGENNSDQVKRVMTYRYEGNSRTNSQTPRIWLSRYGGFLKGHFHTHPFGDHTPSETRDMPLRNENSSIPFFIIAGGNEQRF